MVNFSFWWCWKEHFVCGYMCRDLCAFECSCVCCVCVVAPAYIYTYICAYNDMHLCIYTYISSVYWLEGVWQRKRVWDSGCGGDGKRIVTIRMISFFFWSYQSFWLSDRLKFFFFYVNMKCLFRSKIMHRYTYICMRERKHIHKHTDIQIHPSFGTNAHKENPPSNTTKTKNQPYQSSFLKTFHYVWRMRKVWNPGSLTLLYNTHTHTHIYIYIYIYKLYHCYWALITNTTKFDPLLIHQMT